LSSVLIIDNYDSFTYNLYHLVKKVSVWKVVICKNDAIDLSEVHKYDYIILSPGPDLPDQAGITKEVVRKFGSTKNILGVCLGHQAIGEVFGAELKQLPVVFHGKKTKIFRTKHSCDLLKDLPVNSEVGRYHSWVVDQNTLPSSLLITSVDDQGEIMSLRHISWKLFGVQFHPESYMTPWGYRIMKNFLSV
jgi:anthranilate synthase component 2